MVDLEPKWKNSIVNHKILQLKSNTILNGLIHLEKLHDENDVPDKTYVKTKPGEMEDCNLGIE